jgi:hypothetical protein
MWCQYEIGVLPSWTISLQKNTVKILKCPVAHIRVAVMCRYLFHITASFDERKGILYTTFSTCAHHIGLICYCLKVATHVTASLTSLHDQSFCTRAHKIPSPPHGTSTLEQAPVCTWNMSSSDDDALTLAAFVLMCKRKRRKKKHDVWCKDMLWKGKPIPTLAYWVSWKYIPTNGIIILEWMKKLIWTFFHF